MLKRTLCPLHRHISHDPTPKPTAVPTGRKPYSLVDSSFTHVSTFQVASQKSVFGITPVANASAKFAGATSNG